MIQAQLGVHLLKPSILILELLQALDIGRFHAPIFGFPVVISGIGYAVLPTDLLNQPAAFDLFQNLDDLKFCVTRFLHFVLRIDVVYAGELQLLMPLV